jgi:hypothetical protein
MVGFACFAPEEDGGVAGFDPIAHGVPRKHLKTMTRAVQLGVAAVHDALAAYPAWQAVPAPRRGLFVGGSPQSGDAEDLAAALAAMGADTSLTGFAAKAVPLIPPLWLVKGLSNNILGYASAQFDFQGDNGNWCDGRLGGAVALCNAAQAVAEGRVDLAVAGGADCLRGAEPIVGAPCGEGAAFFVLSSDPTGALGRVQVGAPTEPSREPGAREIGAAAAPVALALGWTAGAPAVTAGGVRLRRASA